jgi:thioredoxin-dependent peroxiredoxin
MSDFIASLAICLFTTISANAAAPPMVGEIAPAFTLQSWGGGNVKLGELTATHKVVLVVLRGWPGYQCPVCDKQVNEFVGLAAKFKDAGAKVVFIYPGPAAELKAHAEEFKTLKGRQWPQEFLFLLDPDYTMTNAFGLRWDAPKETAYPSTFVLDAKGTVTFSKISKGHGDRSKAAEILKEVEK